MHHELFFALLGHAGDVVEARDDGFFVRPDVAFLSPPQRVMIDRLLQLGHAFAVLDRFVESAREVPSVYVRALAQGIEAILLEYSDAVVQLEAKVLATRVVFPIPQLVYELEEFVELLPELRKLVLMVDPGNSPDQSKPRPVVRGAPLLRMLYALTDSGFPRLRKRMSDLLRCCHTVLFKQIISWMAYGDIVDPFDEFFVRKLEGSESIGSEGRGEADGAVESRIWQAQYGIEAENAPPYFPPQVIESIFFIGRSVRILARSKGFSSEEAFSLTLKIAKVQSSDHFSRMVLERVIEDIRTDIASRLYQQVVVKADFVENLKLLKSMFLLARGELFQSVLEQASSSLMAVKPNLKSCEELHHGVWSNIIREHQADENPLINNFRLDLPLQTFRFPPFPDASNLLLTNLIHRDRTLHVDDTSQSCGVAWWPHRQVEHLPFTSTVMLDLSSSQSESLIRWTGGSVIFLLTKDASFPALSVEREGTSGVLYGIETDLVSIGLDIRPIENDSTLVAIVASIAVRGDGREKHVQESGPTIVRLENRTVTCYTQYTRNEVNEANGKVSSARMLTVIVNGSVVLEVERDLSSFLGGTLTNDHYVGLCMTPGIRTREWRLDKYGARTFTQPGRLLTESHESLSARELWSYLSMRCDLKWPMHLLVSQSLLRSYGHLFQFSFRMKRVAHALERTWKFRIFRSGSRADKGDTRSDGAVLRAAAALRARMSFVVRNIEQFFQVFVVESSFAQCLADIDGAEDFDRVKRVHEQFVAQLVRRFYLHTQTMQSAIDQVLRCCWDLAEYLSYQESTGGALLAERVGDLEAQFADKFGLLFRTLRHPNMRDLLLLLDFNGFFSRTLLEP